MIHFAVGGAIGSARGSMGSVLTAAFDPIFWVHHANIDRLWAEWSCAPGKSWGSLPPAGWFDERPWFFHDASGTVRNEPRRAFINQRTLGYTYPTIPVDCRPLELETLVAAAPPSAAAARRQPTTIARSEERITAAAGRSAVRVVRDARLSDTAAASARRTVLELVCLQINGTPSAGFMVFVNRPADTPPDRRSALFVGTVALFGLDDHDHRPGGRAHRFDVTKALAASPASSQVKVEIIPFDPVVSPAGRGLQRPDAITFSGLRIVRN